MWILFYAAVTALVFLYSYQVGKSQALSQLQPCPIQPAGLIRAINTAHFRQEDADMSNLPLCPDDEPLIYDHCMQSPYNSDKTFLHLAPGSIPDDIFPFLHHPGSPSKWSFVMTQEMGWPSRKPLESQCKEIYLTRSGSRPSQPNKCVAIVKVPDGMASVVHNSHRKGFTALLTDQYRDDYPREDTFAEEVGLLPPLLTHLSTILAEFKQKMGDPIAADGSRRSLIVMVANEGVMDLALNFICSAEAAEIDLSSVVMFVGTERDVVLVENMGAQAIYSPALGSMPPKAAGMYLDNTFSRMMWFKTTSVFLAIEAGFDVLFQDVDLVWMKDPIPYLRAVDADISFMDDGARTPRYTPFFVNSGFFYVKHNSRTKFFEEKMMKCGASEIGRSHSHQSVLIKHLSEAHHLAALTVHVLDKDLFPSGEAYHERKKYLATVIDRSFTPFVFHMCWTTNRVDKVLYFKELDLWYLPEDSMCVDGPSMHTQAAQSSENSKAAGIESHVGQDSMKNLCCQRQKYWKSKPKPKY